MWWRKAFHQWPGPLESQNQKHHSALSVSGRIKGKKNTQDASGGGELCDWQMQAED